MRKFEKETDNIIIINMDYLENIKDDWNPLLLPLWEFNKNKILRSITNDAIIYPPVNEVFSAFSHASLADLKVVIIGQDPYHHKDEAHGLAFSVKQGKMPPSLRNIFKELEREYGVSRKSTNLADWAQQGVLLLNTALTVKESAPGSHISIWKSFTTEIIKQIGSMQNIVFMLWGKHAQEYEPYIKQNNLILKHTHPSPLSRKPFVGNCHFSLCNRYLISRGKEPIKWV